MGGTGATGQPGGTGVQGVEGQVGPPGQQGVIGPAGDRGLAGSLGPSGLQGFTGLPGPTGQQGATGMFLHASTSTVFRVIQTDHLRYVIFLFAFIFFCTVFLSLVADFPVVSVG